MTTDLAPDAPAATRMLRDGSGCPTALAPVVARDGLLFRLTLPAGRIGSAAFARLAGIAFRGGGSIEVTNRANLQLRGIPAKLRGEALEAMVDAGGLASERLLRRRTILVSPFAGLDTDEARSPLDLVARIDEALTAMPSADRLSPKFGVAVDFGARGLVGAVRMDAVIMPAGPDDIRLKAACLADDLIIADEDAPDAIAMLAAWLVERGAARLRDLAAEQPPAAFHQLARTRVPRLAMVRDGLPPLGEGPDGTVAAAIPFGELEPRIAAAIAGLAADGPELRLAPWPGIVLPEAGNDALLDLGSSGLIVDVGDPRLRLHACVGRSGCARADTETRQDARAVVEVLSGFPSVARTIHVSGCARGCAQPGRTAVLALGRADGAYDLHVDTAPSEAARRKPAAAGVVPEELPAAIRRLLPD